MTEEPLDLDPLAGIRRQVAARPWDYPHGEELLGEVDRLAAALATAQEREQRVRDLASRINRPTHSGLDGYTLAQVAIELDAALAGEGA